MNNAEYWRKRGEILKIASEKQAADYCDFALDEFEKASARIQKEIDAWYMRFAKNNEISFAEAKKWLTSGELKELHWDVQEYIKAGESLDPKWYKALENASSRVHISRLEALKLQIQQQIEALYGGQAKSLDELMSQIYQDSYYRSIFEIQKGFQLGWEIPRLDVEKLSTVLKKPWTTDGRTFSDRIWGNKDQLVNTLHTSLTQGIIRGESPQKIAAQLAKTMNVAKSNASRLIRTETAYFHEQAQKQVYEDLGVEEYEILETLDTRTCAVCGGLDGKVFKESEYEPGVTAPPFHPNCRGTTVPYFADDEGERIARDINGKTYYVPSNMTYEEWKKQQDLKYGKGTIDNYRKATYNKKADREQFARYQKRLGKKTVGSFSDFQAIKYNDVEKYNKLKIKYADVGIQDRIKLGKIKTTVLEGRQGKHIIGHNNYKTGKSYLNISLDEVQKIVDKYAGTGTILRDSSGKWIHKERIKVDKFIGVCCYNDTEKLTKSAIIHYSKKGVHIVPGKE